MISLSTMNFNSLHIIFLKPFLNGDYSLFSMTEKKKNGFVSSFIVTYSIPHYYLSLYQIMAHDDYGIVSCGYCSFIVGR